MDEDNVAERALAEVIEINQSYMVQLRRMWCLLEAQNDYLNDVLDYQELVKKKG